MNIALAGIVILAGGESSRMGSPKALLKVPSISNMGRTLHYEKFVNLLEFHTQDTFWFGKPILVADNGKNFLDETIYQQNHFLKMIPDYIANAGALSAITSAMQCLIDNEPNLNTKSYLLAVSCDTLIHTNHLADIFVGQSKKWQAYYLKDRKGQDYPLLGLYRLDLLPRLKDFLDKGNRSVMKFLSTIDSKVILMPDRWQVLANFNTPEEFELALKQLEKNNQ